ncbi:hypothetical protein GGI12_001222 [Dipsacomyces acuminosporus]|nr:hypothetical protein GGI12_001222 [Dipsacomyces acuminosporus]
MRIVALLSLGLSTLAFAAALPAHKNKCGAGNGDGNGDGHGDKDFSLRVIHTNDLHAHYDQFNKYGSDCTEKDIANNNCFGGAARIVTTVNKLREGHPNSLLFDAGDQAQGTLFYTVGKFNTTIKFMNQLKYDAMCIGNHEFDDGPNFLAGFFSKLNFPAICANIDTTKNPALAKVVKPYIIIDKYKLGVIGYITNTTGSISSAGPTVSFSDAAEAVNKYVKVLKKKGIKRIIAVSHNGYKEDMDVAAKTHGLDLIVGGHSHTYLSLNATEPGAGGPYPTLVKNLDGHNTYVVQAKAWGEYVGYVDIVFNKDGSVKKLSGEPIHMTLNVTQDAATAENVKEWRKPFETYGETIVGNLTAGMSNSKCQLGECEIGDVVTDAMLWQRNLDTPTDVAIINSGGIRAGIGSGTVKVATMSDLPRNGVSKRLVSAPPSDLLGSSLLVLGSNLLVFGLLMALSMGIAVLELLSAAELAEAMVAGGVAPVSFISLSIRSAGTGDDLPSFTTYGIPISSNTILFPPTASLLDNVDDTEGKCDDDECEEDSREDGEEDNGDDDDEVIELDELDVADVSDEASTADVDDVDDVDDVADADDVDDVDEADEVGECGSVGNGAPCSDDEDELDELDESAEPDEPSDEDDDELWSFLELVVCFVSPAVLMELLWLSEVVWVEDAEAKGGE